MFGGSRASDGENTNQPIYEITGQQQGIVIEADRIRGQLGDIGQSIKSVDQAVERGQTVARKITGSIERSQQLFRECKEFTAENNRIFASIGGTM